jgi:hypothetical protein
VPKLKLTLYMGKSLLVDCYTGMYARYGTRHVQCVSLEEVMPHLTMGGTV